MIPENVLIGQIDGWVGQALSRPECVIAHSSGLLLVPNWSGNGGISLITPKGQTHHIMGQYPHQLRPNGIALEDGGTVLLAHLGETQGGIFRLHANGAVAPAVRTVNGMPMPPANFVVKDCAGRIWVTISTRLTPRAADYRENASTGFIAVAEPGSDNATIVADGLGYTNECVVDEDSGVLWVNETFGRRLTRFTLTTDPEIALVERTTVCEFGCGTYPDGLALDEEGFLWVTSIVSNRVLRISPKGAVTVVLEDSDQAHLARTEKAYSTNTLGREHLDKAYGRTMKNISNLAFGGPLRNRLYLGNLLGDSLPYFDVGFTGVAMTHWNAALGALEKFIAS